MEMGFERQRPPESVVVEGPKLPHEVHLSTPHLDPAVSPCGLIADYVLEV